MWHVYWNGVNGSGRQFTVAQQPVTIFVFSVFTGSFTACQTEMAKRRAGG